MRMKEFDLRGKVSGFISRINVRKGRVGEFFREVGIFERIVDDMYMDFKLRVGIWVLRVCVEY